MISPPHLISSNVPVRNTEGGSYRKQSDRLEVYEPNVTEQPDHFGFAVIATINTT
jgi:hypothetical protein